MRLIVAGQVPTSSSDRELFFKDISLLLQALLGLAVGEEQVCVCTVWTTQADVRYCVLVRIVVFFLVLCLSRNCFLGGTNIKYVLRVPRSVWVAEQLLLPPLRSYCSLDAHWFLHVFSASPREMKMLPRVYFSFHSAMCPV